MGFTDKKLEISILGLTFVVVAGMSYLLKAPVQAVVEELEVVYQMPRPKNSILAALFALNDREVSRTYVNPFAKKKEEAKKVEEKKAAAAPKAVAQNKKQDKKSEETKTNKVDVQVVGSAPESILGGDDNFMKGSAAPVTASNNGGARSNNNPAAEQPADALSGDQWRSLLAAQPTQENISKLIQAFANQELESDAYYTIVTDLLRSNKAETQALGLLAAKAFYSVKSFTIVSQYFDQLTAESQTQAQAYLMTYAASARLAILATVLKSANATVVEMATQVVLEGYKNAKGNVVSSADPRYSRGDGAQNTVAGYAKFIPIFQQLAQTQDQGIVSLANTALSQIQTIVATL